MPASPDHWHKGGAASPPQMAKSPVNRREFFRSGWREMLRPLADLAEPLERAARQFGEMDRAASPRRTGPPVYLRPPGALPEKQFLQACSRCGDCVSVCPAQCIRIDPAVAGGAPFIHVDHMPCVVCDGLYCMDKCPTGALVPTPVHEIDMGTAVWREQTCIRTEGESCTICIDQCPLGSAAIELRDGRVHVIEAGCIGCGVCEYYCPTRPRSIHVIPRQSSTTPSPDGSHRSNRPPPA